MTAPARLMCLLSAFALAPCMREHPPASAPRTATLSATTRPDGSTERTPGEPADAGAIDPREVRVPPALAPVVDAVRREDFREASARLQRLPEREQTTPAGRYLGARIAVALNQSERALPLLRGLGAQLTPLADGIARLEAAALARVGRHDDARAAYNALAARTHAERDSAQAAEQALAQGDHVAAAAVMRRWPQDAPDGIDRARAWRHAAQALEASGDVANAQRALRRIVVDEPDSHEAAEARASLARLGAALTLDETLDRAAHLEARARHAEVIAELGAMPPQRGAAEARRLHIYGRALFNSRAHYAEAHATLGLAGQRADNPDHDEDLFLAARALARADRDELAIAELDRLARTLTGRWADESAYRAALLTAMHDRFAQAVDRLRAFLRERPSASEQLRSDAAWELGWSLYQASRFAEAAPALEQSGQLAPRSLERGRGAYWSAMARLRAGARDEAVRAWQALIADRPITYYALLADARLRTLGLAGAAPTDPAPRRPAPALELPLDVRWLRALGFEREGGALLHAQEDALRAGLPRERADEILGLAYLELGDPHRAYALAQRHGDLLDHEPDATARWAWDCAYPRPYAHWVEAAEDQNHLPRHYLFAIMRQESAYNGRDVSIARAIGLLQMVPPTTRRVAQTLGIEYREELLFEPEYNVRVGGYYIGRLFAQYRAVLPRAIGAFNGGPGAMSRWVARWPALELDAFVERIPFDETRTYVRRVLQNLARYRYLYGPRENGATLQLPLSADAAVDPLVDY